VPAARPTMRPVLSRGSEAISPTAHYTGHVWSRNGLSHPEFATREGRVLFEALRPAMTLRGALGGGTLEQYLLGRHRTIDALLARAIEERGVTQVIELACGLSPRGWRFTRRFGERLTYVEADLPEMAARKRAVLERIGSLSERHRIEEVDVLRDEGPASLAALAAELDPAGPVAVITEGLIGYFPNDAVRALWARIARTLGDFPGGTYLADIQLDELMRDPTLQLFRLALSAFVRGRVHTHFEDAGATEAALVDAGFVSGVVHRDIRDGGDDLGAGGRHVRVIEAVTR
jgi:O-methyltransferase involved in polyketide biosynthesis